MWLCIKERLSLVTSLDHHLPSDLIQSIFFLRTYSVLVTNEPRWSKYDSLPKGVYSQKDRARYTV